MAIYYMKLVYKAPKMARVKWTTLLYLPPARLSTKYQPTDNAAAGDRSYDH